MLFLLLDSRLLDFTFEKQRFPSFPSNYGFRPYLVAFIRQINKHVLCAGPCIDVNWPEAPPARCVPQTGMIVCCPEKNTLPGVIPREFSIGCAVEIALLGYKRFRLIQRCPVKCVHFRHFYDPFSRYSLKCAVSVEGHKAVCKPFLPASKYTDKAGFITTLFADKYRHIIKLAPRRHNARHCANQSLTRNSAGVCAVLRAKIIYKQRVKPRSAVPRQAVQIVPYWVICLHFCDAHHRVFYVLL